jgi:hypothetical protein
VARDVPVRRPLPDVSGHVVEAVAVRREAPDRRRAFVPVELQVLPGELALPGVRHRPPVGEVLVAPGEHRALEPAAGSVLPLRLGGEPLAHPGRVRLRVFAGDVRDRMRVAAVDRGALPAGPLPEGARDVAPPVAVVVEIHRAGRRVEDQRAWDEEVGVGVGVLGGIERPLGDGDVAGLADKATELGRGDGLLVHPEPVDRNAVHRALLGVEVLRAHGERRARDPAHARRGRRRRRAVLPGGRRHDGYCVAIAILKRSSGEIRWSASAAASSMSICTHWTSPVKWLSRGP